MTRGRYEVAAAEEGTGPARSAAPRTRSCRLCLLLLVLALVLALAAACVGAIFLHRALRRNILFNPDGSKLFRGGENITEGDMLELDTGDLGQLSATRDRRLLWPQGRVPYRPDEAIGCPSSARCEVLQSAMSEFNQRTCVRWEPAPAHTAWAVQLLFRPHAGCFSHVGYRRGVGDSQIIMLGDGCFNKGILLHLLAHTLGLWHEHNRPDRDSWISINFTNVAHGQEQSFKRFNHSQHHIVDRMDLTSVMMHGSRAFSSGHGPTLQSHWSAAPLPEVSQKRHLSEQDVNRLQSMYIRQCSRRPQRRPDT
ncbi:zinc metalloproteinase nas-13-like [Pollicipes pollicipes]|uniref:zinc metalloproteinase nas-13-like n=1 Tax=Pollicipes pollicipes TaxID=41117 RepID=UPI0018858DB5|nr:zinc metalloproteinase nas-13-like [Pollicipes pollicipes]